MNTLDITDWKEKGDELKKAIELAVKDTQRIVIRELPNKLLMTQEQYRYLSGQPEVIAGEYNPAFHQEFYLYRTEYNVMEIEVKNG